MPAGAQARSCPRPGVLPSLPDVSHGAGKRPAIDRCRHDPGGHMARRVFISHAASDKPLAGLMERLLIMSGVPRDRVFYSSDRATGVPAGRGSREVLKEMLRDD